MRSAAYEHNGRPVAAQAFYAIACDPRRHVAVEACAGAGKTWMLVSRIVRILFDGSADDGSLSVAPHEVLAITFTKRAAGEMRDRLYQWLEQFATCDDAQLAQELGNRGVSLAADPVAAQAQRRRLAGLHQAVLAAGRPVQIRTFHSWFAAVLRNAPMAVLQQLELPLHYELLEDEAPARALLWRRFYQALLDQPPHKAAFEAVVREYGRFQTEKALSVALDKRIEFTRADASGAVKHAIGHFVDVYPELAGSDLPAAGLVSEAARARWLAWADVLAAQTNKTPQKAAQAVRDAFVLPVPDGSQRPAALADRLTLLRGAFFVADADRLTQHLLKFDAAQQAARELALLCAAQRHHAAWLYQGRMAALSRVLIAEFAALKRERGWIDMNDVERAAITLLSDPILAGWVQERLDARVRHLLIDEFQDTNPLQWQALLSWLGSYAGAGGSTPGVFIVGDPKQSIYRFRRAEPQVFRAAQAFIAQGLSGDLLSCDHTRRNAPIVMNTVNAVMAEASVSDHYDGFRAHTTSSTVAGRAIRLPPIARASVQNGSATTDAISELKWRDSLTQPREVPEETLRKREARQVALWIADALGQGLAASDVMVLSRRRAGLMTMQDELRVLGVPAQVGEKTALIDCCEVLDIVALLDVLVSPQHDLSLARALRSPLFGMPDKALIDLALRQRATRRPWFELLQQDWPFDHVLSGVGVTLAAWKRWLDTRSPHDALQSIFSQHGVLPRFAAAAPLSQRYAVLANLRAVLATSLQVAGGRFITPYGFVRALKAGSVLAPATLSDKAVRLLTIHGAKGLEARAVVLLDTDTAPRAADTMAVLVDWPAEIAQPKGFFFLASEARAPLCAQATLDAERLARQREELNALYVAMTRARDTLVVSSIESHRDAAGSWWQRLVEHTLAQEVPMAPSESMAAIAGPRAGSFALAELPALPLPGMSVAARTDAPLPDEEPDDSAVARVGKAMHRLLEWGATEDHQVQAARIEFRLDPEQGSRAAAMARRILDGPGSWAWDPTQLSWHANEVELLSAGQLVRLDRLVRRKDNGEWWVLDHKSVHAPQDNAALVAQLRGYRDAVQAIHGTQTVRAAFLGGQGAWIELPADAG